MNALALPVVLPLLAAFLVRPAGLVSGRLASVFGPLVLLLCAGLLINFALMANGQPFSANIGGFAPPLGIVFYADSIALLFAIAVPVFALLLWPREAMQAGGERISALMLLLVGSGTGMALSGDLFNLYVFYELLAVASFGLVAASGTPRAWAATVRYLLISGFGSVLALIGVALIYAQTGTLNLAQLSEFAPELLAGPLGLAAFAFLLVGFGVKAELFPVNAWVPEVYATAPKRVSALLAGVVSKLAILVVLRLILLVFDTPEARQLLLVLGLIGLVSGELAAWRARDLPRMLAFSSIGQLGLLFMAMSIPGVAGLVAALAVALHHLLMKPALFLLAERWHGGLENLAGAGRKAPLAAGLFTLFALSLLGVPPLPGFWAKLVLLLGLGEQDALLAQTAIAGVLLMAVVEAHYLFRLVGLLYARTEHDAPPHRTGDLAVASLLGVVLLASMPVLPVLADGLGWMATQASDIASYRAVILGSAPAGAAP
jgi:formate hydrogenlyase subunit 3/multisubunit Na+/H+ antiporter MnhD subunit